MADPDSFPEANLILVGADDDGSIRPLPVRRTEDGRIVSCWRLTRADVAEMVETGVVWLSVWSGDTSPPVLISGRKEDVL